MNDNFFEIASEKNLQDIFASQLETSLEHLKRDCPSLTDEQFINAGANRIISQCKNGREFLQKSDEVFDITIPRTTLSDAMHSARRRNLVRELSNLNYQTLEKELISDKVDYLCEFDEIKEYDVFSFDGHYIKHCSHTERNEKGKVYAAGNIYALNMRNGLMQHFACVSNGTVKKHEMPIFRKRMETENGFYNFKKKTICINTTATFFFLRLPAQFNKLSPVNHRRTIRVSQKLTVCL